MSSGSGGRPAPGAPWIGARASTGVSTLTFWILVSVGLLAVAYATLFSPALGFFGFAAVSALVGAQHLLRIGRKANAIALVVAASPVLATFGREVGREQGDVGVQLQMILLGLAATAVLVDAPIVMSSALLLVAGAGAAWIERWQAGQAGDASAILVFAAGTGLVVIVARARDRERERRARVESDLEDSHARYRSLVENQVELVCRMTPSGRLTFVNGAFRRLFGRAEADLLDASYFDLVAPEARPKAAMRLQAVVNAEPSVHRELPMLVHDGRERWVRWVDTPVRGVGGEILEIQSLGWDVTDLRGVRQRLKAGHDQLLRQQRRLVGLGQVLGDLPLELFLAEVVSAGAEELGVECAQVCELPEAGDSLRIVASSCGGRTEKVFGASALMQEHLGAFSPLSSGEFAQLADGRWADVHDEDGLVAAANDRVRFLASPYQVGAFRAGFLVVQSTELRREWSPEDRLFAVSLAGLVTLAMERHRRVYADELLEDRTHYLAALTELLPRILEPYALKDLLASIVESGARLLGSEDGYLGLVEGESMVPKVGIGALREFEGAEFERGRGVGGRVWASGRPETVNSYPTWEGRDEAVSRFGIQAVICVPLRFGGKVTGVLGVVTRRAGKRFGEVETAILERFADLAVLVVQRTRLIDILNQELLDRQTAAEEVRRLNALLEERVVARTQELGRVSEDLETSRNRMQTILESAPEGIAVLDASGRVLDANPACASMLAMPVERIVGNRLNQLIIAPQQAVIDVLVERCAGGERGSYEFEFSATGGGKPLWVDAQLAPLPGAAGSESRVLLLLRDITDRRSAETERSRLGALLERSARDWQVTFDAVEDVVLLLESGGSILRCNQAARELAGAPYDRIVGAALADLPPEEPWLAFHRVTAEALGEMTNRSAIVRGADGLSWDVSASPLTTGEGRRVVLIARDVTPLEALQESLRKAETFSAIGALVAGVAHEVRNPLFAMSANLDAFEEEVRGDAIISTYVGNLRLEMKRLESLMMGLLDYANPQRAAFASCDLNGIVEAAVRACRARGAANRVTVEFESGVPVGRVSADADQLVQVIQNLIDNAIQHSPAGSRVRIGLERRGAPGLRRAAVVVADSGPGLREEDIPRLFDPFFTRRRGGIGLGLSIAQRIVEQHHGAIWARNRPGGGAEFCVELPAAAQ